MPQSPSGSSSVPAIRIRDINNRKVNPSGRYVVYWMTSARRLQWNFGLQRAVDIALELGKPLVVLEALRCDYPNANDRLHRFVLDGMASNRRDAARTRALYHPYVEPEPGHGSKLLATLAADACAVVTDWYPAFFLPHMMKAAGEKLEVRLEAVDSNGLIPLAAPGSAFTAARFFRAFVQRTLPEHLANVPEETALRRLRNGPRLRALPVAFTRRWPAASERLLAKGGSLSSLPIDHSIAPVKMQGGSHAARRALDIFVSSKLSRYAANRNHPDDDGTSHLSPYLHFGHLSAHEVFAAVMTRERWTTRQLGKKRGGAREGWWGVSAPAEAFLDQLVTWRELAFNTCEYVPHFDEYDSMPAWSRATLAAHEQDPRPHRYDLDALESASTEDPIWNAAQRQLLAEGWFHGYLRMLWGKKILEWSTTGEEALARMRSLMDRYALDGRDPSSYAGYAWVLGRYDRPWPERPIVGTVRYMSSASARRKLKIRKFLEQYGDAT
jgi:deoxyribodipyrimidine photo-lyase